MQPEPHTHSRTHIAIDLKSTSERLQNHFYACLLFVGRILIPTSILYAAIGRVLRTKKAVYLAIVVNILLYGAECWCLTEELLDRLRVFHNQCVRAMCGVKLWHQWRHGIRNRELRRRLKMESLDQLVATLRAWATSGSRAGS